MCAASGRASLRSVAGFMARCSEEQFARLSEGQHPETGEQLVRHQTAREYVNERGETVRSMEHRAGWDATFSAPKIGVSDGAGWRRRPRERGAPGEREGCAQ